MGHDQLIRSTPRRQAYIDGRMLIDGSLCTGAANEFSESVNPADEEPIGRVPAGTAEDVDRAVAAARRAQAAWRETTMEERAAHLLAVAAGLERERERVLEVEVADTGNTIARMRRDVDKAVGSLRYYAGLGLELKGETVPASANGIHFSLLEPYGVVARIIPFNHPIQFAGSRMGAPLMAGNSLVVKPSEQSPLSATILAEVCAHELPPGLVNILTGDGSVGAALVRHPEVRRIAFIGSATTGLRIQADAAASGVVKDVTLELGGKNPMIVFPDADLDAALRAAVSGMNFAFSGQSCGSVSRLFLHSSIYDAGVARVREQMASLRLADPFDEDSQMGPVNSRAQYEKVMGCIVQAQADQAKLETGGKRPEGDHFTRGHWIEPTLFSGVTPEMRLFHEEVFGPVLAVVRWTHEADLLEMVNATDYGLTAAIWTRDLGRAITFARGVNAGYVWVNGVGTHYPGCAFGGTRNSGLGREEGLDELLSYAQKKFVHIAL